MSIDLQPASEIISQSESNRANAAQFGELWNLGGERRCDERSGWGMSKLLQGGDAISDTSSRDGMTGGKSSPETASDNGSDRRDLGMLGCKFDGRANCLGVQVEEQEHSQGGEQTNDRPQILERREHVGSI